VRDSPGDTAFEEQKRTDSAGSAAWLAGGSGIDLVNHRRRADVVSRPRGSGAGDFYNRRAGWLGAVRNTPEKETASQWAHCDSWTGSSDSVHRVGGCAIAQLTGAQVNKGLRLFGHPLHMMLLHFPIALWSVSLLAEAAWLWRGETLWAEMSFWCVLVGLALAVPVAITGFADYLAIPNGNPAERVALWHMVVMLGAAAMFTVSLVVQGTPTAVTSVRMIAAIVVSAGGLALIGLGAWLGGELVLRHGVGRLDS